MQKRSQRMQTVLKLARIKQQLAAEQLGELTRAAQSQEQQEQQLRHYQLEYVEHFRELGSGGANSAQLRNFQGFYGNLEQAIAIQQERAVLAWNQREAIRRQWQHSYAREKNLQKLVERFSGEEDLELEKRIQREQDDRPPRKPR